jgi:tetratricopeptide (TPR) repeat protein
MSRAGVGAMGAKNVAKRWERASGRQCGPAHELGGCQIRAAAGDSLDDDQRRADGDGVLPHLDARVGRRGGGGVGGGGGARPLYLNHIAELDWLIALEFGRVDDAQPRDHWRGVSESFGFLCESPGGAEVGFKVLDFSAFDPDEPEVAEIWDGPRFDAPVLGLRGVSAGEIILAARALFGPHSSINRAYFSAAIDADADEALGLWLACLQAGDPMAHFGLGYMLYDLGRYREACRHLRHYTEIAPCGAWNWCWLGKAAEAVGETGEARVAYERALELEREDGEETDAAELLGRLDS